MKIIHYTEVEAKSYPSDLVKGAKGRVVIGQADGAKNFCMRVFELSAGGYSAKHSHAFEHEVFVHSGKGMVYSQGNWTPVSSGSVIFIPPNEEHQLKNVGEEPFVFLCVIPSGVPEL
ncbi:MAG: cupin domain-containing protein [Deltaproteobacteria bacterium]|nr:cupin domain-containing protein [Deltaproteobacteria bacterium]